MGYVIQLQYVDYDEYPTSPPSTLVGPFESAEAAEKWMDETPEFTAANRFTKGPWGYTGGRGRQVRIVDPLKYVPTPEEWTAR